MPHEPTKCVFFFFWAETAEPLGPRLSRKKAGCQVVEISNPKLTHMILPLPRLLPQMAPSLAANRLQSW